MPFVLVILAFLILAFNNCSGPKSVSNSASSSSTFVDSSCAMADASLRQPGTIDEVVTLINALPKPLELDCLLKNLQGPLQVVAVNNPNSAQPSFGPQNPRIFVLKTPLLIGVVPAGPAKHLLELSQIEASNTSVKAEIEFPVTANVPPALPYDRLVMGPGITSCRGCHANEYKTLRGYAGEAYGSDIIRPDPYRAISAASLKSQALNCSGDAYRCAMLKAIFIDGAAQQGIFP